MNRTTALAPVLLIAAGVALAGCTAAPDTAGPPSADTITVVASTTVYGDLAATIGGDAVEVTSIIDDPNKDPHEYEASAQNQLALSNAQVVIENGGGYDDFVDTMLDSAGNDSATVLDAVDISGKTAEDGEELNEHVWYDFPTMLLVIDEIESAFARLDPDNAETFADNADALQADIEELIQREADLNAQYAGAGVAISEPVPLYLLEAVGLVNKTPDAFSEAIEEGSDVPPSVLLETLELFTGGEVELLAYNEQTTGPQTEQILEAANENDIAVVSISGAHHERALRFDLGDGFIWLLRIEAAGPSRFPADLRRLWNLAPLEEDLRSGWLLNGPFAVDPGRGRIAGGIADRQQLFASLGRALGERLLRLFDLCQSDWLAFSQALDLDAPENPARTIFWTRLFEVLCLDVDDDLARHLHARTLGYGRLVAERPAVPTGLSWPFDGLVQASVVDRFTDGALADSAILERVRAWPTLVALEGRIVAIARSPAPTSMASQPSSASYSTSIRASKAIASTSMSRGSLRRAA